MGAGIIGGQMGALLSSERTDSKASIDGTRVVVLLGAGASADAGLLLTSALAKTIVERANSEVARVEPDWVRALNAVYAGMVGHLGARGRNPLTAVNIETLISAVRLLRAREDHEVAPFVASWVPSLSNFDSSDLPADAGEKILRSIGKSMKEGGHFSKWEITEAVAEIARAAVRPNLEAPFRDAESFILRSLVELLGDHGDVTYFNPLLKLASTQPGGLDVITLNYDLTVETAAAEEDIPVNRGIDTWVPGEPLQFPAVEGTLNLLKLHGSLDWRASKPEQGKHQQTSPRRIAVVPTQATGDRHHEELPWIVVGDREKLATDGPTLALNLAARSALLRATHLAVVGYSFGDDHINAMIRDWLAADDSRTTSILDLHWPRERYYREITDFRSALIASYGRQLDVHGEHLQPRLMLVEGHAREKLSETLTIRPADVPAPAAEVTVRAIPRGYRLDVTWHGQDLTDADIEARRPTEGKSAHATALLQLYSDLEQLPETSDVRSWALSPKFPSWPSGETRTVFAAADTQIPVDIRIAGATPVGTLWWRGNVSGATDPATS